MEGEEAKREGEGRERERERQREGRGQGGAQGVDGIERARRPVGGSLQSLGTTHIPCLPMHSALWPGPSTAILTMVPSIEGDILWRL